MLKWLRKTLRGWLLSEEDKPLSFVLACRFPTPTGTRNQDFQVTGAVGLYLLGSSTGGDGVKMLPAQYAVDREHYERLWKHFAGDQNLHWEDGTPFTQ